MTQKSLKSLNPRTGEVIDTIELMSTSDIDNAVEAAAQAGKIWREGPVEERVKRWLQEISSWRTLMKSLN
mgnify:CR=1 FL=1